LTAASAGIGYGAAQRFGREGATVVISSRSEKKVKKAVKKLKKEGIDAHGRVCHVGNRENRQGFLKWVGEKFGHIDIMSYNAGCGFYVGNFLDQDEKGYDKMFDVNVKALYMFCKEAAPLM